MHQFRGKLPRSLLFPAKPSAKARLAVRVPAGIYTVALSDAAGHTVYSAATDGHTAVLSLDLSDLAAGVYALRAGTATVRVVKE